MNHELGIYWPSIIVCNILLLYHLCNFILCWLYTYFILLGSTFSLITNRFQSNDNEYRVIWWWLWYLIDITRCYRIMKVSVWPLKWLCTCNLFPPSIWIMCENVSVLSINYTKKYVTVLIHIFICWDNMLNYWPKDSVLYKDFVWPNCYR